MDTPLPYLPFILIFVILIIISHYYHMEEKLEKLWAQRINLFDLDAYLSGNYSHMNDSHDKYGRDYKLNKYRYIADETTIRNYRKFNLKWRFVACGYYLVTLLCCLRIYLLQGH